MKGEAYLQRRFGFKKGKGKAIARGSRTVAAAVALTSALSSGKRFDGMGKEAPG